MALSDATFTLTEWSGASSRGFMRIGMPFKQGDVPAGSTVILKRSGVTIDAQFDQRTTWSDGSLKFAVCAIRDTTFSANEVRTYVPTLVPSSSWNNTGSKAISDITGAHDFNVLFQNVTTFDGTTTHSLGSGRFTLDVNAVLNQTISGVATRLTKIHSGIVCETWMAWGMATDVVGGAAAKDLKGYVYVTIWKNADQSIADFEHAVVLAQDWWGATSGTYSGPKYRLNYDATYQDGVTTIQSYPGIQHPYQSTWITCRMQNDNNSGRRQWVTQIPTLGYQPSQAYWVSTRLVPPLNTTATVSWQAQTSDSYVPCENVNVNAYIDGTGGSNSRGIFMNTDCIAFLSQIQVNVKIARLSALSALGVPYHYRSNRTRTRPQDSGVADIASCPISQKLDPQSPSAYDFTSEGMPVAVWAYAGSAANPTYMDSFVAPQGGSGVWVGSVSASHASPYCYFAYMLEGERHHLEALQDLSSNLNHQTNGDSFGGRPSLLYYEYAAIRAALSIPSTQYSATGTIWKSENVRAAGWCANIFAVAAALTPDQDAQGNVETCKAFFVAMNGQAMNYAATSITYSPTTVNNAGWWLQAAGRGGDFGMCAPWMNNICAQGAYHNYQLTEDANAKTWGDMLANATIGLIVNYVWRSDSYVMRNTSAACGNWNGTTVDWLPIAQCEQFTWSGAAATDGTITIGPCGAAQALAINDTMHFMNQDSSGNLVTIPPELNQTAKYWVVAATISPSDGSGTIKISATQGGSPITFASPATNLQIAATCAAQTQTPAPITEFSSDSYPYICRAAITYAAANGKTGASAAYAAQQAFVSLVDANLEAGSDNALNFTWFMATSTTSGPSLNPVSATANVAPFMSSLQASLTGAAAAGTAVSITNWQASLTAAAATAAAESFAFGGQPHLIGVQALGVVKGLINTQASLVAAAATGAAAAFPVPLHTIALNAVAATGAVSGFTGAQLTLPSAHATGAAATFGSSGLNVSLIAASSTAGVGSFSLPVVINYTLNALTGYYRLNGLAVSLDILQPPPPAFQFDESYATPFTPPNQVQFIAYNPFLRQLYVQYWSGSIAVYQNVPNGNVSSIIAALNKGVPPTQVFGGLSPQ